LTGCSSYQRVVPVDEGGFRTQVQVGDAVSIVRLDGRNLKFVVDQVNETAVSGEGVSVKLSDIQSLKIRSPNRWKTGGLITGIALLAGAITFLIFALNQDTE